MSRKVKEKIDNDGGDDHTLNIVAENETAV